MLQSVPSIWPFWIQRGSWAARIISKAKGKGEINFPSKSTEYRPWLILVLQTTRVGSRFQKCLWICISWLLHLPSQLWPNAFCVEPNANAKPFPHFQARAAGGALLLVDWQHRMFQAWLQEAFAAGQFPASQQGERSHSRQGLPRFFLELELLDRECFSGPDYHTEMHTLHNKSWHTVEGTCLCVILRGWCTRFISVQQCVC